MLRLGRGAGELPQPRGDSLLDKDAAAHRADAEYVVSARLRLVGILHRENYVRLRVDGDHGDFVERGQHIHGACGTEVRHVHLRAPASSAGHHRPGSVHHDRKRDGELAVFLPQFERDGKYVLDCRLVPPAWPERPLAAGKCDSASEVGRIRGELAQEGRLEVLRRHVVEQDAAVVLERGESAAERLRLVYLHRNAAASDRIGGRGLWLVREV